MADRTERISFELLNLNLDVLDELHPIADAVPSVDYDKSRKIKRTLSGLVLSESDMEVIDPFAHLIRPVWTIDGEDHYCGAYIPADVTETITTAGTAFAMANCDDLSGYFDEETYGGGVSTGQFTTDALGFIVAYAGITQMDIETSSLTPYTPILWDPGEVRGQMVDECAAAANQWWYIANPGPFTSRSIKDPSAEKPDHSYAPDDGQMVGEFYERRGVTRKAPNTFIVVNTGASDIEVAGEYRIPASCPHSVENRGRVVPKFFPMQGVASVADAEEKAWMQWLADESSYETVEFDSIANPALDCFSLIEFNGVNHLEVASRMELVAGGNHHHVLARKVWS